MKRLDEAPGVDDLGLPFSLLMLRSDDLDGPRFFEHHWLEPVAWGEVEQRLRASLALYDPTSAYELAATVPDVSPGPLFATVHRGQGRPEVIYLAGLLLRSAGAFA